MSKPGPSKQEPTATYHPGFGWCFERLPDGKVRITSAGNDRLTLTAESWASAVSAVSRRGEAADTFAEAKALHTKHPPG